MDAGAYLIGVALLVAVAAACATGARALRAALLPEWSGGHARLGEIVLALALVVVLAELLGTFGRLERGTFTVSVLVAGTALGWWRRARAGHAPARTVPAVTSGTARSPGGEIVAAGAAVMLVGAQWAGKVAFALDRGMTHPDTVWYHATYSARFWQRGDLLVDLDPLDPLHAFAGHTSELLHAALALVVGRDVFSPLVNLGWAALALLAAWSLGARFGAGALAVLGATVVLGVPAVGATHPGQASNDVAAAALVLAALALVAGGSLGDVGPAAVAGLAAGLAVSTKVTAAAAVAVLSAAIVAAAWRRRRPRLAAAWLGALALTGGYWFVRNAVVAGNPLPFYEFAIGPLRLDAALAERGESMARYLFHAEKWRGFFVPGFRRALGPAWPALLAGATGGAAWLVARGRAGAARITGAAAVAGLVAYPFTPYTAHGEGLAFVFNVRYAVPALGTAVVCAALVAAGLRPRARAAVVVALLAIAVLDATARHHERVPAWPSLARVAGPVAAFVVAAAFAARYALASRRPGAPARHALVAAALVAAALSGWPLQRHALDRRYVEAGLPLDALYAFFGDVHGARVAVFGTSEVYPFFGTDLSNRVRRPPDPAPRTPAQRCRAWLDEFRDEDYVVIAHEPLRFEGPDEAALARDRGIERVATNGDDSVYRVTGPLEGNAC